MESFEQSTFLSPQNKIEQIEERKEQGERTCCLPSPDPIPDPSSGEPFDLTSKKALNILFPGKRSQRDINGVYPKTRLIDNSHQTINDLLKSVAPGCCSYWNCWLLGNIEDSCTAFC